MSSRPDFLVEIGTEELPPRTLRRLARALRDALAAGLDAASLAHGSVETFATPRRLAVLVHELQPNQADRDVELRGPPERVAFDDDGTPTRAATAFAAKCGVDVDQLERVETDKGTWLVHRAVERGSAAPELLPRIVSDALTRLPVPRPMRWGGNDIEFVRPVHWIVMLLGDQVVEGEVLGLRAGRDTRGHRFHGGRLELATPADYVPRLAGDHVIAAFAERRRRVRDDVARTAAGLGGEPVGDDELLDEVTALVEWPVALGASFDERFLALPEEVLIETLQAHQRYFPVRGRDRRLTPHFVTVANIDSRAPDVVRAGNERVVIPRLADAEFFFDADRRRSLEARAADLHGVVFQRELGTLHDKTQRVERLAGWLAGELGADAAVARRAARLAKCDLVTEMVGEFPSLQGTMGRYYALHDGEDDEVAVALEEQYLPRFAGDRLPATPTGSILAIADKMDTIAGIFAIGQRPSGTRDPFGLRRAALGIIRIVLERRLDLDLRALIAAAVAQLPVSVDEQPLGDEIYGYFIDRLRAHYLDDESEEFSAQMFEAVAARAPARVLDFDARIRAVREFAGHEAAESLSAANKRIANILRSTDEPVSAGVDTGALREPAERELHRELERVRGTARPLLERGEYTPALEALAELRPAVDQFFDDVMVLCDDDDLRRNRLALLHALRELFLESADLSRLQS